MRPVRCARQRLVVVADDDSLLFVTRRPFAVSLGISLLVLGACDRPSTRPRGGVVEPSVPDARAVGFDIEPFKGNGSSQRWLATYRELSRTIAQGWSWV